MGSGLGIRRRLRGILNRFSGEHSEAAPEETTPYDRPGVPNDGAEVVMARLHRPRRAAAGKDSAGQDSAGQGGRRRQQH